MELKTTKDAKELLGQAAILDGMDLTSFVLGPAIERARKVLADHAIIALSKRPTGVGGRFGESAQADQGDERSHAIA